MKKPLSVGVGGSKSGVGKTSFVEDFIRYIKNQNSKITITAVKYTKTSLYSSIITEPQLEDIGKDTNRMKKAGADYLVWVKAKEEDLQEIVFKLKEYVNNLSTNIVIIEGNSLVRLMQPDIIIFLKGKNNKCIKSSARALIEKADILIEEDYSLEKIMKEIEFIQKRKLIYQLLREKSSNGRISCAEARKIAEELLISYIEVGKAANELGVKIIKCELGCF
ncbi:MAG: molybdopterin-guanine dinucleotide biosynthesis protein MobB [Thermodesulfovibrionaceae bacterium]